MHLVIETLGWPLRIDSNKNTPEREDLGYREGDFTQFPATNPEQPHNILNVALAQ